MSLYRKYRPGNFSGIVGQDAIRDTLLNAVKNGKVNHAYLFTGPRGTGKTSAARILAKTINCTSPKDFSPCEKCEICMEIKEGRLIDLIEIDAASNRGIDEMRDLKEKINFAPSRAKNKIYIIDEVHMLTKEAFNALLKTLEEPPDHVYFILATTEVHKIPETILSRCQRFDFKRIAEDTIVSHLKFIAKEEGVNAEDGALELIAYNADGGMRDAIGLFEKLIVDGALTESHVCEVLSISGYASIEKLYDFLKNGDSVLGLKEVQSLYGDGFDLINFNKNFLEFLRKKMIASVEGGDSAKTARLLKLIDNFQESYGKTKYATIAQLPLEIAVVKSCLEVTAGADLAGGADLAAALNASSQKRAHKGITAQVPAQSHLSHAVLDPAQTPPDSLSATDPALSAASPPEIGTGPALSAQPDPKPRATDSPPKPRAAAHPHSPVKSKTISSDPLIGENEFRQKWGQILGKISVPSSKRAFSQSKLLRMESHNVILGFATQFYLGKMTETANKIALEKAIEDVFGVSVKVISKLNEDAPADSSDSGKPPHSSDLGDAALEDAAITSISGNTDSGNTADSADLEDPAGYKTACAQETATQKISTQHAAAQNPSAQEEKILKIFGGELA